MKVNPTSHRKKWLRILAKKQMKVKFLSWNYISPHKKVIYIRTRYRKELVLNEISSWYRTLKKLNLHQHHEAKAYIIILLLISSGYREFNHLVKHIPEIRHKTAYTVQLGNAMWNKKFKMYFRQTCSVIVKWIESMLIYLAS